jgi:hypothetical protein
MGGIPGQIQPPRAQPFGNAVLQPDPCGPRKAGDLHAQPCFVQERLKLSGGDRGADLPERQLIGAGRPGREQPPGRLLAEAKGEQQSSPPGHNMGGATGEITIELRVSEHDFHGLWAASAAAHLRGSAENWLSRP